MMASRDTVPGPDAGRSAKLSTLLEGVHVSEDVEVRGLGLDSRAIAPGDLFLAVPGDVHDGRQFIEQAAARGAVAVVAEPPVSGFVDALAVPVVEVPDLAQEAGWIAARFYGHPGRRLATVAVTGTNGKTTTSRLVAQLNRALGRRCGVIGTLGSTLGNDVVAAANTTPDAVTLQAQLADWCDEGVDCVAMEVSSHALVQGRVNGLQADTAIFTNLSHDHLDYHGSMEAYGRAKLQLFTAAGLRRAVINIDDPFGPVVRDQVAPAVQRHTYSASGDPAADFRIEDARFHPEGVRGTICSGHGSAHFESPLPGDFNLANLLAAVAALVAAGSPLPAVAAAVSGLEQVPGRLQRLPNHAGIQVIVDYAHTPHALEQVLGTLRPHVEGALVTVFGCGGDRDPDKRAVMGRVACDLSDRVIVTSDNPRGEDPLAIIGDIASGCLGNFAIEADRAAAIALAIADAAPGDCVVIAGKGHEDYQLVAGERVRFSDSEQAAAALSRRVAP